MFATELAMKKIPVRVNAIAPGVFESEMTKPHILPEEVDMVAKGTVAVPAKRAGT
jgi:NAD(P)-dependent dehydrogenase (short-subunit alcohol dehydrogenase family)